MKIAVYGSAKGEIATEIFPKAREIGRELGRLGHTLITGACIGLPYEAALGAQEQGGKVIGYAPTQNAEAQKAYGYPTDGFNEIVYIPKNYELKDSIPACLGYRNIKSVSNCDAAIIISGRNGTLNEMTLCYSFEKPMGILKGSGGIADLSSQLIKIFQEKDPTKDIPIIVEKDPIKLVAKLLESI